MITIDINKRKKSKSIIWFFVAQAFLQYIHNYLDAFPFTKKITFIINENKLKKIQFHTIEDFMPSTVLH